MKNTVKKNINTPRHSARIAAVQALYQHDQTQENINVIVLDMIKSEFSSLKEEDYIAPEIELFKDLTQNGSALLNEIDPIIETFLSDQWKLSRLSYTLRAILRLATFELKTNPMIAENIIFNEYIEITKEFSESKSEVSFVNGILDKIAKNLRS